MPSRDSAPVGARRPSWSARPVVEWALRVLALLALAWTLWRETRPAAPAAAVRASASEMRAARAAWRGGPAGRRARAALGGAPTDTVREWLGALRAAGVDVGYEVPRLAPVAVAVEALADPAGLSRVLAAAPAGAAVSLAD